MTGQHTSTGALVALLSALLAPVSVMVAPSGAAAQAAAGADTQQEQAGSKPPTHHFEAGAFLGATWIAKPLAVEAGIVSNRSIGFGGALSLAYRGPFFLYPFLDVGYWNLAQSTIHPISRLGISGDKVHDTLAVWTFQFGPAVDIGPMRLRFAVGISDTLQSSKGPTFHDELHSIGFANGFSVAGTVVRTSTLRLNVEGRANHLVYSGTWFFNLGLSGSYDFANW